MMLDTAITTHAPSAIPLMALQFYSIETCRVGQQYTFTYGWICRGANYGRNVILETTSTGGIREPLPLEKKLFTCYLETGCEIVAQADTFYCAEYASTGYFMHVYNGRNYERR